jgi:type II secretory pathway pseudopilin PulG
MRLRRGNSEEGFTMIPVVIGVSLIAMLVLVAVTAVNGDSQLSTRDLLQKQAYEAAKAGVDNYAYHLHADNSYWTSCDKVAAPSAVNLQGSTTNKQPVPGNTGAKYAIELLPSTTQATFSQCSTANPTLSMLESSGKLQGTFRIRSTGYDGAAKSSIVATFKPASFLDYVYFTQYETSDPIDYGSELEAAAIKQCEKTIAEGRYKAEILPGKGKCDVISFAPEDSINGPMHTNDAFAICGSPTLGRTAADPIEVSSPPRGWYQTKELTGSSRDCSGTENNFKGTFTANAPVLKPPPTNSELMNVAEPRFRFKGQVRICLSGASMTVMTLTETGTCTSPSSVVYSGAIPANGVVYISSGKCSTSYNPLSTTYKIEAETKECGDAYIQGTYSGQLTIAAENNIVITEKLCMETCSSKPPLSGSGVLGLIANNFVRVYHPVQHVVNQQSHQEECLNATGSVKEMVIDAAILAIKHSFIVDNYNCGSSLGFLTVIGAIAQKYRGAVGTTGGNGYTKNYNYDDRLRYIEPPSFIEPEKSAWVVGRETLG